MRRRKPGGRNGEPIRLNIQHRASALSNAPPAMPIPVPEAGIEKGEGRLGKDRVQKKGGDREGRNSTDRKD